MATVVKVDSFGGIQPRLDATALGDTQATVALNCRLHTTKLNPIQQALDIADFPIHLEGGLADITEAKTIVIWDRGYDRRDVIAWPGIVQVAHSNINADNRWRIFVSGETGVSDANGKNQPCAFVTSLDGRSYDRHRLHIPTPLSADVMNEKPEEEVNKSSTVRYTYFFQTWVDEYGYESGMSPVKTVNDAAVEINYIDGDPITWHGVAAKDVPDQVVARRLYKAVAGSEIDTVRYLAEQTIATDNSFTELTGIKVKDEDVGEEMPNITSIPVDLTSCQHIVSATPVAQSVFPMHFLV